MKNVKVDEGKCIACGLCESITSDIFKVEDVAQVIVDEVPEELVDAVEEAIEACPTSAISWVDEK